MKCLFCLKNKKNIDIKSLLNIKNYHGKIIYSFFKYEKKYSIDDSVISKKRFKNENNLDYIKLSEKIEIIEENAFENCENLKFISYLEDNKLEENKIELIGKIADKKIVIQKEAFYNCINLETVIFPTCNHLVIEKNAFENCQTLRTLILDFDDSGYLDIHPLAFSGCSKLVIITKSEKIMTYCRNNGVEYLYVK